MAFATTNSPGEIKDTSIFFLPSDPSPAMWCLSLHYKAQVCSCLGLEVQHACVLNHSETHLTQHKISNATSGSGFLVVCIPRNVVMFGLKEGFRQIVVCGSSRFCGIAHTRDFFPLCSFPTAWPIGSHLCLGGGKVRFNCHMPTTLVLVHVQFVAR